MMKINCSTCLESFTSGCDISTTPCGHVFHTGCITRWLNQNDNCSQCREACEIRQIIKLYFSESQSAIEENIKINDLEQKSLKLEEQRQTFERELTAIKTQCKKLEHEKLLMKLDWSKTEWNLKRSITKAYIRIKDLEKEMEEQKLTKLDWSKTKRKLKKSINEANKQIKDLEKEVDDQKSPTSQTQVAKEKIDMISGPQQRKAPLNMRKYRIHMHKLTTDPVYKAKYDKDRLDKEKVFKEQIDRDNRKKDQKSLKRNLKTSINKAKKQIKEEPVEGVEQSRNCFSSESD